MYIESIVSRVGRISLVYCCTVVVLLQQSLGAWVAYL